MYQSVTSFHFCRPSLYACLWSRFIPTILSILSYLQQSEGNLFLDPISKNKPLTLTHFPFDPYLAPLSYFYLWTISFQTHQITFYFLYNFPLKQVEHHSLKSKPLRRYLLGKYLDGLVCRLKKEGMKKYCRCILLYFDDGFKFSYINRLIFVFYTYFCWVYLAQFSYFLLFLPFTYILPS